MAGPGITFEERAPGGRADLAAVLAESFSGIYLWHARRILFSGATVLAALRGEVPAGLVMVKTLTPVTGYVYYVAVAAGERQRGTGGLLLDEAITMLTARGSSTILACITRANVPSERLMSSRGFLPVTFRDLRRRFGALAAVRLWMGMTVAPGETVTMRQAAAAERADYGR